ncbi:MAG: rhamnosyltransferase subunit B [Halieaceae bacterium]|jgi:rhamnosyltransferase subunit B
MLEDSKLATILLANAWGAGQSHARSMRLLAESLRKKGHKPVLVVPNYFTAYPALADTDLPVLSVPRYSVAHQPSKPMRNYSDLLAKKGFADPIALGPTLMSCQGLLDVVKPDLLIVDHAPTIHLAAFGEIPVVVNGVAICVPPGHGEVFPDISDEGPESFSQATILNTINDVQAQRGRKTMHHITELFPPDDSFVLSIPELDVYRETRQHPALGPFQLLPNVLAKPDMTSGQPTIFAYLSARQPGMLEALNYLAKDGFRVETYLQESTPQINAKLRTSGIVAHDTPVRFAEVLGRAHLLVHHGSQNTGQEGLAFGRPQLCFTIHRENELIADILTSLGVSRRVKNGGSFGAVAALMRAMCFDSAMHGVAQDLAHQLPRSRSSAALEAILGRCESILS